MMMDKASDSLVHDLQNLPCDFQSEPDLVNRLLPANVSTTYPLFCTYQSDTFGTGP